MKTQCKEENCNDEVEYKPKRVFGLKKPHTSDKEEEQQLITIYLTCPNGHTHAYRVTQG